jgi:hypothetical protein
MRYEYMTEKVEVGARLAELCNRYARIGWRVHTVTRSDSHGLYRVLFERDVENPPKPNLFEETT